MEMWGKVLHCYVKYGKIYVGRCAMEKYYTPEQIAQLLQVNVVTVHRWLRDDKLKSIN